MYYVQQSLVVISKTWYLHAHFIWDINQNRTVQKKRPDPIVEEIRNKNGSGISIPTLIRGVQKGGGKLNINCPKFNAYIISILFKCGKGG